MSVGFVILVHTSLDRVAQTARHLAASGAPVVMHIDQAVSDNDSRRLQSILRIHENIRFCPRFRCEWGTWEIVEATKSAANLLLQEFPDVDHVYLTSGSCMPLRPVSDLRRHLEAHPDTDFIESVDIKDVRWTHGGLDTERFTLRFPFAWKSQRWLFDRCVDIQRFFGVKRKAPKGIVPHMGSQWWCLSRTTLEKIENDPRREEIETYFRNVWIPDEAYFQTMVRQFSSRIEGRSLTLSKFDYQGRPYTFYDDHLELLRRSDCFFARKIWPKADRLYQNFLGPRRAANGMATPDPARIDDLFNQALSQRTHGRPGLVMQSRFPRDRMHRNRTAAPYSVLQGFDEVFEGFEHWLSAAASSTVHGRIFHPARAQFANGKSILRGGLTNNPYSRDYNRAAFLRNLIWNTRGERQFFMYGPDDGLEAWTQIVEDPNAQVSIVTGAWAIRVLRADLPFEDARKLAAKLQQAEQKQLDIIKGPETKAKLRVFKLSEYLANPMEPIQEILDESVSPAHSYLGEAPKMARLSGLDDFLRDLRNCGMQPYLAGHIADGFIDDESKHADAGSISRLFR